MEVGGACVICNHLRIFTGPPADECDPCQCCGSLVCADHVDSEGYCDVCTGVLDSDDDSG